MSKLEQALWQAFDGSLAVSGVAKHANHDQKSHGNWAQGEAKFNYRDWSQYKGNYIQRQLSAKAMGLPFYEVVRYNAESAWDESLPKTTTGRGIDPEMQAAVDGDLSQLNDTQRKRFIRQQQSVEGALQELRDTDLVKDRPLFRGLLDADPESSLFTTPVGEALRLPLSAFSSDAKVARSFAGLKRGREESAGLTERPEVMIVLAPGARILKHGQFRNSPMRQYRDESTGELRTKRTHMFFEESGERVFDTIENVTAGEFRITNRRLYEGGELGGYGSQPHWVIEIEHTGVFNPDTGNFDPIDRDGDGTVFEGTDQERFVGKHAEHDQKSHGNWATGRGTSGSVGADQFDPRPYIEFKGRGRTSARAGVFYLWSDHSEIRPILDEIAELEAGGEVKDTARGQAAAFIQAKLQENNSLPDEPAFYRGTRLDSIPKPGEKITMEVRSWGGSADDANRFTTLGGKTEGLPVMLEVQPEDRKQFMVMDTTRWRWDENKLAEVVGGGTFRVVGTRQFGSTETTIVEVVQEEGAVATPDIQKHAEHDQKSHGNWDAAYLIDEPS